MDKPKWKIYYSDGSTYSSLQGPPESAPAGGVIAIVQRDESSSKNVVLGHNYYWYECERWCNGDTFGLYDFLIRNGQVKFGKWVTNKEYDEITHKVYNDPDFQSTTWQTSMPPSPFTGG